MSRRKITEESQTVDVVPDSNNEDLNVLIPKYYENKAILDDYKKICDAENSQIKELLTTVDGGTYSVGDYTAKRIISHRENVNEAKMLEVLKRYNITEAIKTVEVLDTDALENFLYHADSENDPTIRALSAELANCKSTTEVIQLRVSRKKSR